MIEKRFYIIERVLRVAWGFVAHGQARGGIALRWHPQLATAGRSGTGSRGLSASITFHCHLCQPGADCCDLPRGFVYRPNAPPSRRHVNISRFSLFLCDCDSLWSTPLSLFVVPCLTHYRYTMSTLRDLGNEHFKAGQFKEAEQLYTEA